MTSFKYSTTITFMSCIQYYAEHPWRMERSYYVLHFLEMKGFLTTQRILRLAKGFLLRRDTVILGQWLSSQ